LSGDQPGGTCVIAAVIRSGAAVAREDLVGCLAYHHGCDSSPGPESA
jgi:hypothetical protein